MINKHNTQISNVLVIGSGGAGLRAAIEAKMLGMEVTVLGKRQKNRCSYRSSCRGY
jgi:succinate dehydrogenase / fumarate reductase flavoprotein subunit